MADEYVTSAHLDAVRGELHARIDLHRAEMTGELKALSAKLDASRSAQEVDSLQTRGALERLTTEMKSVATAVDQLEDGETVSAALASFKTQLGRRMFAATGLIVAVAGAVAAFLAL